MKFLSVFFLTLLSLFSIAQINITEEPVTILALGDSYTYGQNVEVKERWVEQLLDSLDTKGVETGEAEVIAITGWRTDNLINAIKEKKEELQSSYSLVGLLIGVNNYYQGRTIEPYKKEFEELLITALSYVENDTNRVFVISIPDYAYTPFGNGNSNISTGIDLFNTANFEITQAYNVPYINITPISRNGLKDTKLVANDGLHPSGKQYGLWVSEILKQIQINKVTSIMTSNTLKNNEAVVIWDVMGHKVFEGNLSNFTQIGLYIVEQNQQRFQVLFE